MYRKLFTTSALGITTRCSEYRSLEVAYLFPLTQRFTEVEINFHPLLCIWCSEDNAILKIRLPLENFIGF